MVIVSDMIADRSMVYEQGPQAVILNAIVESDLHDTFTALRAIYRHLKAGDVYVAYVEDGARLKEPYSRVTVTTPEDCYGDVIRDLNRRLGQIEALTDRRGGKIVVATAPASELIAYGMALNRISHGQGHVDYEFLGYDYVWPRAVPPDPRGPAVARRA